MQWVKLFSGKQEATQKLTSGKPQLLIIHGKRICLILHNDSFYAVQDRCTHNSESLSKGSVNYLGEVICPWHNYRFDLKSGKECASRSAELITYPVRIKEDGVFIGIF